MNLHLFMLNSAEHDLFVQVHPVKVSIVGAIPIHEGKLQ